MQLEKKNNHSPTAVSMLLATPLDALTPIFTFSRLSPRRSTRFVRAILFWLQSSFTTHLQTENAAAIWAVLGTSFSSLASASFDFVSESSALPAAASSIPRFIQPAIRAFCNFERIVLTHSLNGAITCLALMSLQEFRPPQQQTLVPPHLFCHRCTVLPATYLKHRT